MSRSLFLAAAVLILASVASAAVGTICRNQDPYISCTVSIVQAVTPPCEANSDKVAATSCWCSTLSQHKSCYEKLCTTSDSFIDIFNTMFNSKGCPNAPALKTPVYTTRPLQTNAPAATTPAATGQTPAGTSAGAASTTTSKSGAGAQGGSVVFRGAVGGNLVFLAVAGVVGSVALFGALL
ncbi:hypothetical protein B0T26DRAFT_755178 [Lasiosphaeria miniovina]|uniref:Extracellular membrane protein CFEM domain-containing protein n=1 Tax=Lasiosphaeria miniovina TaxID=1954250 RepID=A0AA40A6I4_9PEZI|nr:uncharacterized protein B0T26DRAFT_755178 [Lasiosphaeria miniovina]KAK0710056.1 hypothetical protein B0T26DRAFT_755178 [Lasiosphaeria miniovina]